MTAVGQGTEPTATATANAGEVAGRVQAEAPAASRAPAGPSLVRSSGTMAAGTLASRFTGFVRTAVLLYAIGTKDLGDAYNVANSVPNAVYNLALGEILTSVAVPPLVNAAALIGAAAMAMRIAGSLITLAIVPPADVVAGLGAGYGLSNLATAATLGWVLNRRLGGLEVRRTRRCLVRLHLAAVPGVIFAVGISALTGAVLPAGTPAALVTVVVGGSGALVLYLLSARALKIGELRQLTGMLRTRLGG